eukprot:SAG22_NODE_15684_length_343_cov_1.057377_1_plen_91_part_10
MQELRADPLNVCACMPAVHVRAARAVLRYMSCCKRWADNALGRAGARPGGSHGRRIKRTALGRAGARGLEGAMAGGDGGDETHGGVPETWS